MPNRICNDKARPLVGRSPNRRTIEYRAIDVRVGFDFLVGTHEPSTRTTRTIDSSVAHCPVDGVGAAEYPGPSTRSQSNRLRNLFTALTVRNFRVLARASIVFCGLYFWLSAVFSTRTPVPSRENSRLDRGTTEREQKKKKWGKRDRRRTTT